MAELVTPASLLTVSSSVPLSKFPVIGTHNGSFHCDEALATAILKMTDKFRDAVVVRTRTEEVLAACNVVVDVGGVYDAEKLLFDHHQKEFNKTMTTSLRSYKTRLSSAGLVYLHFGREVIRKIAPTASEEDVEQVFDSVYKSFIEHIDGIDNGVEPTSCEGGTLVKNYAVSSTLSARVGRLAPRWNQPSTPDDFHEAFKKAVELTGREFIESVDFYANAWLPARQIVQTSIADRYQAHESGLIVVFKQFCPWEEHLYHVEKDMGLTGQLLFVLFPDSVRGWRVRAIGVEGTAFGLRKPLPWKGIRDDQLSEASGIQGCIFVHANGFIGGNETYEGALQMAIKALKE